MNTQEAEAEIRSKTNVTKQKVTFAKAVLIRATIQEMASRIVPVSDITQEDSNI